MIAVANALGVSLQHLSSARRKAPARRRGRPRLPAEELVERIHSLIAALPTYGLALIHALLRRQARNGGSAAPSTKRGYRAMKVHGLLLQRHGGKADELRRDGRVPVDTRNTRRFSDGFEFGCDNGETVRVTVSLDCCDREAMGFVATNARVADKLNARAVINRLPNWLHHNNTDHLHRALGCLEPRKYINRSICEELPGN